MHSILIISCLLLHQIVGFPTIDQFTLDSLKEKKTGNIILTMTKSPASLLDNFKTLDFFDRNDKLNALVMQLQDLTNITQKNVANFLEKEQTLKVFQTDVLWITNQIIIWGADLELVEKLLQMEDLSYIEEEKFIPLFKPMDLEIFNSSERQQSGYPWGVEQVQAPEVWKLGGTGEGVIVCNIDTGVRGSHEALRNNFVGEFGWYDAVNKKTVPYDDMGHGTHVMGTIAGRRKIGVSPGSTWSACKACGPKGCSQFSLFLCGQWVVCPTKRNGSLNNCTKTPHIVSNSWGGESGDSWFIGVTKVWETAGIISIFAIGNSGPSCGSSNSPGDYENVIGIGAACSNSSIATFSSVGPTKIGTKMKPEVVAPGHKILSAWHIGDRVYATLSGTSMACPHAAGVTALLLGKKESLSSQEVKNALEIGGDRTNSSGAVCGDLQDNIFPNYHAGYGRINALKSWSVI